MDLEIINFIKKNKDWKELISKKPYCIKIVEDENYILLKYNQIESDFHYNIVRECRGLILDKHSFIPIALSFYKFFNVQEEFASEIDWKNCEVQEKIDGTKILLWFDNYSKEWRLSTSSVLDAFNANVNDFNISFGDLFNRACNKIFGFVENEESNGFKKLIQYLDINICYTFELVSPESRLIVPYSSTEIFLIGMRNIDKNSEMFFKELTPKNSNLASIIKTPKQYPLTNLDQCIDACSKMNYDEEGFVVVDKNWNRVKIKSPAFVTAFYIKGNEKPNKKRFLEMIESNEEEEFLSYFPEYSVIINSLKRDMDNFKEYAILKINTIKFINIISSYKRKDVANFIIKNNDLNLISKFLFKALDYSQKTSQEIFDLVWNNLSISKKLDLLAIFSGEKEDKD